MIRRKGQVLNAYYDEKGGKALEAVFIGGSSRRKPCDWCDRFREADFYRCFNCGRRFKSPGSPTVEV